MGNRFTIKKDDLQGSEIIALLERHMAEMETNSPPGSCHYLDLEGLRGKDVSFWSLWQDDRLLGCGAVKELDESHGEIKSMHVHSDFRGKGVSEHLLNHIIGVARERGYTRLSLETGGGPAFIPARKLYEKHGFVVCAPFGDYAPNPHSVFMTRVF